MKTAKTLILSLLLSLTGASCGLSEIGNSGHAAGTDDVWVNPAAGGSTGSGRSICYVTGLDYPAGYDWRADRETGSVKCSLVVFADGLPVMKVPVGDSYEISADPDMHRMIAGHLYTDFVTETETVIKKDGRLLFRYTGKEIICGMAVLGNDLYTLGNSRDGAGFSFRKNGAVVVTRTKGYAFSRLQMCDDTLCFTFCEPITSAEGTVERYYHVRNGKVSQIAVREDVKKVRDAVWHKDMVCYLADVTGVKSPVLFDAERMSVLEVPDSHPVLTYRMWPTDDVLYAVGMFSADGTPYCTIWSDEHICKVFDSGYSLSSVCTSDDGIACVLNASSSAGGGLVYRFGEELVLPLGYASRGTGTLSCIDGILHVGLTPVSSSVRPAVWKDGEVDSLRLNGFVATVSAK